MIYEHFVDLSNSKQKIDFFLNSLNLDYMFEECEEKVNDDFLGAIEFISRGIRHAEYSTSPPEYSSKIIAHCRLTNLTCISSLACKFSLLKIESRSK